MRAIKQAIYGRIRTHNKVTYTKRHGARSWKDRILKPKISSKDKCLRVELWKDGKHKTVLVHRLVANAFLEKLIDSNMTVNHIDGNRLNNRIDNLEWLSRADNIRYGFANGQYSCCKKCKLMSKNGEYLFKSIAEANRFLNRNYSYIDTALKRNRTIRSKTGEIFKFELI
jgi:hypothetical protein